MAGTDKNKKRDPRPGRKLIVRVIEGPPITPEALLEFCERYAALVVEQASASRGKNVANHACRTVTKRD